MAAIDVGSREQRRSGAPDPRTLFLTAGACEAHHPSSRRVADRRSEGLRAANLTSSSWMSGKHVALALRLLRFLAFVWPYSQLFSAWGTRVAAQLRRGALDNAWSHSCRGDGVRPRARSTGHRSSSYPRFLVRRWKIVSSNAPASRFRYFYCTARGTPRYTGVAQVLLDPRKEKIFGAESVLPELSLNSSNVDSQISVIRSTSLLRQVVDKYKLTQDIEFGEGARSGLFSALMGWFSSKPALEKKGTPLGEEDSA